MPMSWQTAEGEVRGPWKTETEGFLRRGMGYKHLSILDRFPDKSEILIALMARNSEFLGMCEDHEECMKALRYWARSNEPDSDGRVKEYCDLVRQLEEEIIEAVADLEL